jgi:hypothetical protein
MSKESEAGLTDKASESTETDKLVLALLRRRPSKTTSVQKLGLIVHSVFTGKVPPGFAPHFFGGFNDDIDNSLDELLEEGYIWENDAGEYALTPAGKSLIDEYLVDPVSTKMKDISERIVGRMTHLSDRDILAVAYEMFPELTQNSLIKDKVAKTRRVKNVEMTTLPH